MLKKQQNNKHLTISKSELECLLAKASKQGAIAALKEIGLDDDLAYMDIQNLRELLKSLRIAKSHAFKVFIKWATFTILTLVTAGLITIIGDNIEIKK